MKSRSTGHSQMEAIKRYLRLEGATVYWRKLEGDLTRTERRHNTLFSGKVAGALNRKTGYRIIQLQGLHYREHVVVFFLHHGRWPESILDHKNGNKLDNHPSNLRESDHSKNAQNSKTSTRNTSGVRGVSFNKLRKKWKVKVTLEGVDYHGGWFDKFEDAKSKAISMRKELHKENLRDDECRKQDAGDRRNRKRSNPPRDEPVVRQHGGRDPPMCQEGTFGDGDGDRSSGSPA